MEKSQTNAPSVIMHPLKTNSEEKSKLRIKMVPFSTVEIRMGGAQLSLLMGGSHSLWDPLLIWGDISVEKQEDQS